MALQNKKSLGQHWLKDRLILDSIAELSFSSAELCVEIGPGLGTLTSSLLKVFPKVTAIEFDPKLAANLPKSFPGKSLAVINQDILKFDFNQISEPYAVAGNIPYYITSPIIDKLLNLEHKPQKIVLLIQKEVAERLTKKGGKNSVLSLTAENLAEVKYGFDVPREFFTPPPKVDSAVVVLTPREAPQVDNSVLKLIKQGFSNPRKKLSNNLGKDLPAEYKDLRPADLDLKSWQNLAKLLQK